MLQSLPPVQVVGALLCGVAICEASHCVRRTCRRRRRQPIPARTVHPAVAGLGWGAEHGGTVLLNKAVAELWPRLRTFLQDTIESRLHASLSTWYLEGLGVTTVTKVDVGHRFPDLGPLACRRLPGPDGGMELRLEFSFHSALHIELQLPFGVIGIRDLELKGTLAVFLRPLLDRPPFVGGIELTCINPPSVDYSLIGVGRVAHTALLDRLIRDRISDALAAHIVTPHHVVVPLCAGLDLARASMPSPIGVLRLSCRSGQGLPQRAAPWLGILRSVTPTPFVSAALGGQRTKFQSAKNTCDPVWDRAGGEQSHDFFVFSTEQVVQIEVLDEDLLALPRGCTSIGRALIADPGGGHAPSVQELRHAGTTMLRVVSDAGRDSGTLTVQTEWLDVTPIRLGQSMSSDSWSEGQRSFVVSVEVNCAEVAKDVAGTPPFALRLIVPGGVPETRQTQYFSGGAGGGNTGVALVQQVLLTATQLQASARQCAELCEVDEELVEELLADGCDFRPGRHPPRPHFPPLDKPGLGKVLRPTPVQENESTGSAVQHVLQEGAEVEVVQLRSGRARIIAPVPGWVTVCPPEADLGHPHVTSLDDAERMRDEALADWATRAAQSRLRRRAARMPQWRETLHFITRQRVTVGCELIDSSGRKLGAAHTELSDSAPVCCGPFELAYSDDGGVPQRAGLLHAIFTLSRLEDPFSDCLTVASMYSTVSGPQHSPAQPGLPVGSPPMFGSPFPGTPSRSLPRSPPRSPRRSPPASAVAAAHLRQAATALRRQSNGSEAATETIQFVPVSSPVHRAQHFSEVTITQVSDDVSQYQSTESVYGRPALAGVPLSRSGTFRRMNCSS